MRVLVGEAARRGLTLTALAKLCDDRDPRALAKTIVAEHPRPGNVRSLASALDYPAIVAHALLCTLEGRHAVELRGLISSSIEGFGRQSLGTFSSPMQATHVLTWLESQPVNVTLDVGRECILALYSLGPRDVRPDLVALGAVVGPIVSALRANGYSNVFAFTHFQQSPEAKATLAFEAQAWTHLLCEALGLETRLYFGARVKPDAAHADGSRVTRKAMEPKDSGALYAILGPYLKRGSAFLTKHADRPEDDLLDLDALQRFSRAKMAARRAFRETFYSPESKNNHEYLQTQERPLRGPHRPRVKRHRLAPP